MTMTTPTVRRVPTIPPPGRRIRVVIDADTDNEVDDQYAVALALLSPERLDLRGFVAAHFGDGGGPEGIQRSFDETKHVMELAGMAGRVPVLRGNHPMRYSNEPSHSEGVDFILEEARKATPDDPLWIVSLGPMTDGVSAYLLDPSIADRVVVVFHSRSRWHEKFYNGNVFSDVRAARALLQLTNLPLVLFDNGFRFSTAEKRSTVSGWARTRRRPRATAGAPPDNIAAYRVRQILPIEVEVDRPAGTVINAAWRTVRATGSRPTSHHGATSARSSAPRAARASRRTGNRPAPTTAPRPYHGGRRLPQPPSHRAT